MKVNTVILAAGKGTRMQSNKSKLVHEVWGKPMIKRVVETAKEIHSQKDIVVVGYKKEEVKAILKNEQNISFVEQKEQLGTGHAVMQAIPEIEDDSIVITLFGDCPLISKEILSNLINRHYENNNNLTMLTAIKEVPTGYGRIIRDENKKICKIVEEKDCSVEEKKLTEVNVGIFCFNSNDLKNLITKLTNNNAQNEYYLTDLLEIFVNDNKKIGSFRLEDDKEVMGVNDKSELEKATKFIRNKINKNHMLNGVILIDSDSTYIEENVVIGKDTTIYPNTVIKSGSVIGENVTVGYNCIIRNNKKIKDNTTIKDNKIV